MRLAVQDPTTGRFTGPDTSVDLLDRVIAKIDFDDPDGCWIWTGACRRDGYGEMWSPAEKRVRPAHRLLYELLVHPVPAELDMDHLCRRPSCVNPDHLEPVTRRENLLRGCGFPATHAAKTHCPRGHPYDEANTYRSSKGIRMCRACHRERERERRGIGPSRYRRD